MPRSRKSVPARRRKSRPPADRVRYSSGTPWEPTVGYSRAVRVGRRIYVSGTTATAADGSIVGRGDAYAQTVQALDNIERALVALGSRTADIVRIRLFVTDIGDFVPISKAIAERFRPIRPACTLVQVAALVDPAMKIEVEADAELPARR